MLFSVEYLLEKAIAPALDYLGLNNDHLDCFLAAVFIYSHQETPQYGSYRISHDQHWDLWDHYLVHKPELASAIRGMASQHRFLDDPDLELNLNIGYATAIAAFLLIREGEQQRLTQLSIKKMAGLWQKISPTTNSQQLINFAMEIAEYKTTRVA